MKKYLKLTATFLLIFLAKAALAQTDSLLTDTTLTLDVLTAPASPGSVLLGVNPSEVQKPTDLTGLWTSFRNASNNFTSFPTSFAVDIAPKWVFDKKSISFEDFAGSKKAFAQTFTVSLAQTPQEDNNYNGLKQGLGLSFFLVRPAIKDEKYLGIIASIRDILPALNDARRKRAAQLKEGDSVYQSLQRRLNAAASAGNTDEAKRLLALLEPMDIAFSAQAKAYADSLESEKVARLKELQTTIVPVRKGFFLSLAAGTIVRYDNFKATAATATNKSVWINLGYDGAMTEASKSSYFSFLGLSRFIVANADELYKSGTNNRFDTWDNALRIAYTTNNQRFTISGEGIARKLFDVTAGRSFVYKYLLNIELHVGKNRILTFSYGKDFENHITKDGNVIGYLNFVTGLFNQKKLK